MMYRKLVAVGLLIGICMNSCVLFTKNRTYIEPTRVALVDESRIDNAKVRHIFAEFLVQEIVHQGKGWLTIYDSDTYDKSCVPDNIDYVVVFDVMESGIDDIEKGTTKLLVSTRLVEYSSTVIVNSLIADTSGAQLNELCKGLARALCAPHVKTLKMLRTRQIEEPAAISEPADSAIIQMIDQ